MKFCFQEKVSAPRSNLYQLLNSTTFVLLNYALNSTSSRLAATQLPPPQKKRKQIQICKCKQPKVFLPAQCQQSDSTGEILTNRWTRDTVFIHLSTLPQMMNATEHEMSSCSIAGNTGKPPTGLRAIVLLQWTSDICVKEIPFESRPALCCMYHISPESKTIPDHVDLSRTQTLDYPFNSGQLQWIPSHWIETIQKHSEPSAVGGKDSGYGLKEVTSSDLTSENRHLAGTKTSLA